MATKRQEKCQTSLFTFLYASMLKNIFFQFLIFVLVFTQFRRIPFTASLFTKSLDVLIVHKQKIVHSFLFPFAKITLIVT